MSNILFVCAENDGINNCKAGGMGDVVRDVPRQISQFGDKVSVLTPSYGRLHVNQKKIVDLHFLYRGKSQLAELYEVEPKRQMDGLTHYVIHHPEIKSGNIADIYFDDPEQPFYTDACTFSIFCIAAAQAINDNCFGNLDVAHLHDWHTSLLLFLKNYHPQYKNLNSIRFVYSIHNLAIQGIRPFNNNYSSLQSFYPEVSWSEHDLVDPRYKDCINLMAIGIRFSDAVHTVSESYKEDILKPSKFPDFIGGEGLENDLTAANNDQKLFGILNGSNYSNINEEEAGAFYRNAVRAIFKWLQKPDKQYKSEFLIHTGEKIADLMEQPPSFICASVARLTQQKFYMLKAHPESLEAILKSLKKVNGIYVILGTGAPEYEAFFRALSYTHKNLVFFNGQSEEVIDSIYTESNLYLMPSLFEPCGISQMLAMRNGQPCLVHATGGLKDTVQHLKTGFVFDGDTLKSKSENMVKVFNEALDLYFNNKRTWNKISKKAKSERFTWSKVVKEYYSKLYNLPLD
ncbi:MAG: glycogen synthase [Bacteroidetes bacterium MedPE-SWsnd-G2]|nr:MAG: glycogen synthase [Bacteroidetes bacterium MedPE-SWsnd-G2]